MDGFPIVSALGSCCLGVGLCQLLPSTINVIMSSNIHPHSPTFAETISAEIHLIPPPAFTAVISVLPGQSSSSSAEVCTALPHLLQVLGTLVLFPRVGLQGCGCRILPRLASNPGTAGLQSGALSSLAGQAGAAPGGDITGKVWPDITRGNEAAGGTNTRMGQVVNVMKYLFTESERNEGPEVASGNVAVERQFT